MEIFILEADNFIFSDKSAGMAESFEYIAKGNLDKESVLYYNQIIRTRNVLEDILEPIEKLVFTRYFNEGLSMKEIKQLDDFKKYNGSNSLSSKGLKNLLATVGFKFLILTQFKEVMSKETLDKLVATLFLSRKLFKKKDISLRGYERLFNYFFKYNTCKHNIHDIIDLPEENNAWMYFETIFYLAMDYKEFLKRCEMSK